MNRRVNVGLRYEVYTRLKDQGRFGESFSDLVSRIIDAADKITVLKVPVVKAKLNRTTTLDFISRDCRNGKHNSCHARWEGMGFEIICVCNCGHKLKANSPIFAEESQYSVTGCPPRFYNLSILYRIRRY